MLAGAITALIVAAACFVYGLLDSMDLGKVVAWHLASGVAGVVACTLFLVWTAQKLFPELHG